MATEDLAEPWLLGIGPTTGELGSAAVAAGSDLGADLQAAISAAVAVAAMASSQNRRGAPASCCPAEQSDVPTDVRGDELRGVSCLIVVWP